MYESVVVTKGSDTALDYTLLYLIVGFALSALYFEFRVRRFVRGFAPRALQSLQDAFFDTEVSEDKDGREVRLLRPNARLEAFLSGLVEWARTKVKLPKEAGGLGIQLPEGASLAQLVAVGAQAGFIKKKDAGLAMIVASVIDGLRGGKPLLGGVNPSQKEETRRPG